MNFITQGIFAIYKPKGPTSHDVVDEIRKLTGVKKVGHAGTLDPLASGVLVVGIGRDATKKLGEIVQKEKEYRAIIELGAVSETDDAEGPITARDVSKRPSEEGLLAPKPSSACCRRIRRAGSPVGRLDT